MKLQKKLWKAGILIFHFFYKNNYSEQKMISLRGEKSLEKNRDKMMLVQEKFNQLWWKNKSI